MNSYRELAKGGSLHGITMHEQVPLARFSTMKIGGAARFLFMPDTPQQIALIQMFANDHGIKLHMMSGGSNTLFSDEGFDGIVMKLSSRFDYIEPSAHPYAMTVGAATSFAKTTKVAVSMGWSKALGWCGTPGLLGGAIRMNAGTRMGEIADGLARVYGVLNGLEVVYDKHEINFDYRSNSLPFDLVIYKADLACDKNQIENVDELNLKVQEYRRRRRQTQPSNNSLGSFFKNPYPHFAAQLIEKCNLKGLEYKGAQISPLHANFLVNNGGASAEGILYIASIAQQRVFDEFGITLTPEVRMVGIFARTLQNATKCT